MQIKLAEFVKSREEHDELEKIIRSCVHCGFCNATCPTYQLTGDELDGPRGRIYLLKQMLEGQQIGEITQYHLDRCLNCLSCETTCPSGVEYGRLLDLGRVVVEEKVKRPVTVYLKRQAMLLIFPYRQRFQWLMVLARLCKPLLPSLFRKKIPAKQATAYYCPQTQHNRKIILLSGCVQPTLAPSIDLSTARVLDKIGISLIQEKSTVCCGALHYHLSEHEKAKALARKNIDQCWLMIEQGAEAIIMTASGCGATLKEYGSLLQYDLDYIEKARQFSALVKDISEVLIDEDLSIFKVQNTIKVSVHEPCTLQHSQQLSGLITSNLQNIGYALSSDSNAHLCCGSAGVYSLLQPELSVHLRDNKLKDLQYNQPDYIATANVGCLTHLQANTSTKVIHWIELLDEKNTIHYH